MFQNYWFKYNSLLPLKLSCTSRIDSIRATKNFSNKICVVNSFLFIVWLRWLKLQNTVIRIKVKKSLDTKHYSILTAPMAHKTHAQEQINTKLFRFDVRVAGHNNGELAHTNGGAYAAATLLTTFPFFETNLFFLKRVLNKAPNLLTSNSVKSMI